MRKGTSMVDATSPAGDVAGKSSLKKNILSLQQNFTLKGCMQIILTQILWRWMM